MDKSELKTTLNEVKKIKITKKEFPKN